MFVSTIAFLLYVCLNFLFATHFFYHHYITPQIQWVQVISGTRWLHPTYFFRFCHVDDILPLDASQIVIDHLDEEDLDESNYHCGAPNTIESEVKEDDKTHHRNHRTNQRQPKLQDKDPPNESYQPKPIPKSQLHLDQLMTNGAVILPSLLPPTLTHNLRQVLLAKNQAQSHPSQQFFVLNHDQRFSLKTSIPPQSDPLHDPHDILSKAVSHIVSNPTLQALLTGALNDSDPAVVELSAITVQYGAESQPWHPDSIPEYSAWMFGHNYNDLYTVFVALQDTTPEMGATELCLGTHMCMDWQHEEVNFIDGEWRSTVPHICDQITEIKLKNGTVVRRKRGFQASLNEGDSLIYNSQMIHRGRDHVEEEGGERVQLLLSFAARPMRRLGSVEQEKNGSVGWSTESADGGGGGGGVLDWRMPPDGATYALKWDSWGRTMSDLMMKDDNPINGREHDSNPSDVSVGLGRKFLRRLGLGESIESIESMHSAHPRLQGWRFLTIFIKHYIRKRGTDFDFTDQFAVQCLMGCLELCLIVSIGVCVWMIGYGTSLLGTNTNSGKTKLVETLSYNRGEKIQKRVVIRTSTVRVVRKGCSSSHSGHSGTPTTSTTARTGSTKDAKGIKSESIEKERPGFSFKNLRRLFGACVAFTFLFLAATMWISRVALNNLGQPPSLSLLGRELGNNDMSNIIAKSGFAKRKEQNEMQNRMNQIAKEHKDALKALAISKEDVLVATPLHVYNGTTEFTIQEYAQLQNFRLGYHPGNRAFTSLIDRYIHENLARFKPKQNVLTNETEKNALISRIAQDAVSAVSTIPEGGPPSTNKGGKGKGRFVEQKKQNIDSLSIPKRKFWRLSNNNHLQHWVQMDVDSVLQYAESITRERLGVLYDMSDSAGSCKNYQSTY